MTVRNLAVAAAALVLTATSAFAAPCATGTTTNMNDKSASKDKSSMVDGKSTTNVTPGAKGEAPGTVGAMNNVGANTQPAPGEKKPAEGQVVKGANADNC